MDSSHSERVEAAQPKKKKVPGGTVATVKDGTAFQPDDSKCHEDNIEACVNFMLEKPDEKRRWCCPIGLLNLQGRPYKQCGGSCARPFPEKLFLLAHVKDKANIGDELHKHTLELLHRPEAQKCTTTLIAYYKRTITRPSYYNSLRSFDVI